ncbi:MAG: biotin/lipoate A/B protein ligase family protein [Acidiferrobacterales bacterium]|nr:biotin/lipoate A/B protein ligase family protein [Acidiferrobacterales bacterium]
MKARLLTDDSVDDQTGLSVDDALARISSAASSLTLRLYTYQPCVLVGRFQHVRDEVDLNRCRELRVPVNRRPTGGGAIIMGPEQLGIALVVPPDSRAVGRKSASLMRDCAKGIVSALRSFGVETEFRGKNDLVVSGRKIAGLGLYQAQGGGILFHASLLLDLDIQYMLTVLKTAFGNTPDRGLDTISQRIATLRGEVSPDVSISDLTQAVELGFAKEFSIDFYRGHLSPQERMLANQLVASQYGSRQWIYHSGARIKDRVGCYRLRTQGGTLDVRAIVAKSTLKSVFVNGDFIAAENAISDLESSLRWHKTDTDELNRTIERSHLRNRQFWDRISAADISQAVLGAIGRIDSDCVDPAPNSCFVRSGMTQ